MPGTAISSLRNLGPAVEKQLIDAGIKDAESLRTIGAHEAYRQLLLSGVRPHFIGYYVLHMALQGRPWNDCHGSEKNQLRQEFDRLKQEIADLPLKGDAQDAQFLAKLDEIGVIAPFVRK